MSSNSVTLFQTSIFTGAFDLYLLLLSGFAVNVCVVLQSQTVSDEVQGLSQCHGNRFIRMIFRNNLLSTHCCGLLSKHNVESCKTCSAIVYWVPSLRLPLSFRTSLKKKIFVKKCETKKFRGNFCKRHEVSWRPVNQFQLHTYSSKW